jgi:hypothetical protein
MANINPTLSEDSRLFALKIFIFDKCSPVDPEYPRRPIIGDQVVKRRVLHI